MSPFPCGRLVANSPCTLTRDFAVDLTNGRRLTRRVSDPTSQPISPFTPASSDDTGSNPSCGRVKFELLCDCCTAMKFN